MIFPTALCRFSETVVSFHCSQNSTLYEKSLTFHCMTARMSGQFDLTAVARLMLYVSSSSRRSEWTVNLVTPKGGIRDVYQGA